MPKCKTKYCRKPGHAKKGGLCHSCYYENEKQRRPIAVKFRMLKANAKKRGVAFNLTLAEFKAWCKQTGYHQKAGREPGKFHVDRINRNDKRGYHLQNIQMMESSENVRKWYAYEAHGLPWPNAKPEPVPQSLLDEINEMQNHWIKPTGTCPF